jgi:hypothetical protein
MPTPSDTWAAADERWRKDRDDFGWKLPAPAAWPWRLPVIRHIRAAYNRLRIERHYIMGWGSFGVRSGYDEWVVYAIQRGWC